MAQYSVAKGVPRPLADAARDKLREAGPEEVQEVMHPSFIFHRPNDLAVRVKDEFLKVPLLRSHERSGSYESCDMFADIHSLYVQNGDLQRVAQYLGTSTADISSRGRGAWPIKLRTIVEKFVARGEQPAEVITIIALGDLRHQTGLPRLKGQPTDLELKSGEALIFRNDVEHSFEGGGGFALLLSFGSDTSQGGAGSASGVGSSKGY
ncbi:MAG: hypothetical protein M1837_000784 [Sclerophora amabilis]|nr:MAG: hypothetical protein M1837_000784 [Sclerophora amabilis]